MKCPKCDGKGWYDNPKYPNPASYSHAGEPSIKCKHCNGTGYIIGDVKDLLAFLKHLQVYFEKDKHYYHQVKQCIDIIEKQ